MAVDTNFAVGNFAVSNHFGRLTSVSDSSLARSMLPRSISNSAFDLASSLGRNTMLAFQRRKRPSTLTPICRDTNRISLFSMSTPWAAACVAASSIMPSDGMNERNSVMVNLSFGNRQHSGQDRVAVVKVMLQRREGMQTDHPEQGEVQRHVDQSQDMRQVTVLRHQVGQRHQAEVDHLDPGRRAIDPARQRDHQEQRIERDVRGMRGARLPRRHGWHGRRGMTPSPCQPRAGDKPYGDADPLVPRVVLELLGRYRKVDHRDADGESPHDQQGRQPMQCDRRCAVAL